MMWGEETALLFLGGLGIHQMTFPQCAWASAGVPELLLEPEQNTRLLQTHTNTETCPHAEPIVLLKPQ